MIQLDREGRSWLAAGTGTLGEREVDAGFGLAGVFNFDAIVKFLLTVPILFLVVGAAHPFVNDDINGKQRAAGAVAGRRRDGHGFLGGGTGLVGRRGLFGSGNGDRGVAGPLSCLCERDVHRCLFVGSRIDGPGDLGDG